jgi:hypothetical protein
MMAMRVRWLIDHPPDSLPSAAGTRQLAIV